MRNFFRSPIFRCLVCLVLVCCILVNVSPIRANAFAGGAALTAVVGTAAAVTVVAGAMQALGVMPTSDTSIFEGVVNDCVDALTASGVFINGMLSVLQLSDGVVVKNHVNQGIIQAILDWLFASENIQSEIAGSNMLFYNGLCFADLTDVFEEYIGFPYALIRYSPNSGYALFLFSSVEDIILSGDLYQIPHVSNGLEFLLTLNGSYYSRPSTSYAGALGFNSEFPIVWSNFDIYLPDGSLYLLSSVPSAVGSIAVAPGLVAGQIGTDIKTDYETWVEDGVVAVDFGIGYIDDPNTDLDDDNDDDTGTEISPTVPPGEIVDPNNPVSPSISPSPWWQNNKWLNIGGGILGWSLADLTAQLLQHTQTQTQTGVGDPSVKVDTSLFGNNGNGNNIIAPPDTGDPDPSNPTTPSDPDVSVDFSMMFDLKDFFPFCIPFDLYDFFSVLDAPPEAPQFHWELRDLSGNIYPIDIDLSTWDDLASFFRKFQLFLFIIGLASATRKYIKW